jgi:DHA2 family multidrug resistance protein
VMPVSGRLYNRLGPRALVTTGLAVSAFSFYGLSRLTSDMSAWDLFWPQVWQGVGFGLIFVALSTAALATIEKPRMTAASGLYNVVRQVFGSVGIAVAATQLTANTTRYRAVLADHVTAFDGATRQWLSGAAAGAGHAATTAGDAATRALALLDLQVTRQAMVLAYGRAFVLVAILFAAALPLAFLLPARSHAADPQPESVAGEA